MKPREPFTSEEDLLFLPLGGAGEIGMNLNLYGYAGKWLMVDLGITFADGSAPGVDLIAPDPAFIAERRDDLLGLVLTHAHEDHLGAVPYLWSKLRCPIWATPFTAALLRRKLQEVDLEGEVTVHVVPLSGRIEIAPFEVELINLTHSILEPNALMIRTPAGSIMHTGDWKLDPDPLVGEGYDDTAMQRVGEEGVLALVCDSTNVFNPGLSGSEAAVRDTLSELCAGRTGRIAITTFASNAARIATVAEVARMHGRELVVVGRSLDRIISAARETGYLEDLGNTLRPEEGGYLPPDRCLFLCTGCQGEPRGAMARIAAGQHPHVVLEAGDTAIFSSKIIPGNELAIGHIHNQLISAGVKVITEKDEFVHVSGHPCQDELAEMYRWVRPDIAVPVHGEYRHLVRHAELAREFQVAQAVVARNGQVVRLAPGRAEIVGEVQSGRLLIDGASLVPVDHESIRERRRMMFNGNAVVTVVVDSAGQLKADPVLVVQGLADGNDPKVLQDACDAAREAIANLTPGARRDDGRMTEAVRLSVRRALRNVSGKNPVVEARLLRL